jgi:hypothetical protein
VERRHRARTPSTRAVKKDASGGRLIWDVSWAKLVWRRTTPSPPHAEGGGGEQAGARVSFRSSSLLPRHPQPHSSFRPHHHPPRIRIRVSFFLAPIHDCDESLQGTCAGLYIVEAEVRHVEAGVQNACTDRVAARFNRRGNGQKKYTWYSSVSDIGGRRTSEEDIPRSSPVQVGNTNAAPRGWK